MKRYLVNAVVAVIILCLAAGASFAERMVLIPTGNTLDIGLKAEYATRPTVSDGHGLWVAVGIPNVEIEGAWFEDEFSETPDAVSVQFTVIPQTSFTPGIAVGVRDISNNTEGTGVLYNGRAYYLAFSKTIDESSGLPILLTDVKLHFGVGTGSLGGAFFGAEATLPIGLTLGAEYDSDKMNYAASFPVGSVFKVKASLIDGEMYYGGVLCLKK